QGDRAGAPGRHPHRVRRCPVSGRGHASRRVRLPDQTRRAGKGSRRRIRAGRFRQDLYYRLNEFVIVVPALRERMEDIVYLAERFLAEASMELQRPVRGISDEGVQVLLGYHWPGNVRELRNVIRRAVLLSSDLIEPGHLLPLPANSPEARPVEVSAFLPPGLPLR